MEIREKLRRITSVKGLPILFLCLLAGVLLLFLSGRGSKEDFENDQPAAFSFSDYEQELEKRLVKIIEKKTGISGVRVMLTLESSSSLLVSERNGTVLEKNAPKVRGVAVLCAKGGESRIRREITELLSALLGLPSSRIYVGC